MMLKSDELIKWWQMGPWSTVCVRACLTKTLKKDRYSCLRLGKVCTMRHNCMNNI